ncbi:MAG: hypothetical protein J6Z22_00795 [Lachnospiraceae bacterium]|nr:hypothetical protein [Lachnospiraceae bacterium]
MSRKKDFVKWENPKDDSEIKILDLILEAAWESIALLLLVFAGVFLLKQVSELVQMEKDGIWGVTMLIIGGTCFYEIFVRFSLSRITETHRRIVGLLSKLLPAILGLWLFLTSFQNRKEEIQSGITAIEGIFIRTYNRLYGVNLPNSTGDVSLLPSSFYFCVLVAVFACLLISGTGRRKWIFLGFPVMGAAALMTVGLAPKWGHILVAALGAFMICRSHQKKNAWPVTMISAVVFLLMTMILGACFSGSADHLLERSKEVKVFEEKVEAKIQAVFSGMHSSKNESIANSTPRYKDVKILTIKTSSLPTGNLYLQDFSAENYENGVWLSDEDKFYQACEEHDISPLQASLYLKGALYELATEEHIDYELDYQGLLGRNMLLPYAAEVKEISGLTYLGDSVALKGNAGKVRFSGCCTNQFENISSINYSWTSEDIYMNVGIDLSDYNVVFHGTEMSLEDFAEGNFPEGVSYEVITEEELQRLTKELYSVYSDKVSMVGIRREEEELDFWSWYDDYVMNECRDVPDYVYQLPAYRYLSSGAIVGGLTNTIRMDDAKWIANALQSRSYTYSWNLDALEDGQDPIEYFLKESQKGYCIHFASAGVLLLRSLGVPARYASGYVVKPSQFVEHNDGTFTAQIVDRNKHAWVEIYLQEIGWIPVEVTPGYSDGSEDLPTSKDAEEARREQEAAEAETSSVEEESTEVTPTESPSPTPSATNTPAPDESKEVKEGQKDKGADIGKDAADREDDLDVNGFPKTLRIALFVVILIILIGLSVILVRRQKERKLRNLLGRKYYKAAVLLINRQVYRKLRRSGRLKGTKRTDRDYEKSLVEALGEDKKAEVAEYMRIVKEAAFSGSSISKDDCMTVWSFSRKYRKYGKGEL